MWHSFTNKLGLPECDRPVDLLVISYLDYPYYSGLSRRISGLIKVLASNGIKVMLIAPIARSDFVPIDVPKEVIIYRVDLRRFLPRNARGIIPKFPQWLLFNLWACLKVLRICFESRCLIQYESVYSFFPALMAKLLLRAKIIGDDVVSIHRIFDVLIMRLTDVIVTASPKTYSYAKQLGKLVLYIMNGIEQKECKELTPTPKPVILFVGTLSFDQNLKAVENIIKITSGLNTNRLHFEVVIVGGPLNYAEHLFVHPVVKNEIVKFVGNVSDDRLEEIYRTAFIGILPFFQETPLEGGQRTKALEYFANGLLVISGPEGVKGICGLEQGKHYLLASSLNEMHEILNNVLSDPEKYVEMARAGCAFVTSNYSWQRVSEKYVRLIKELLGAG